MLAETRSSSLVINAHIHASLLARVEDARYIHAKDA